MRASTVLDGGSWRAMSKRDVPPKSVTTTCKRSRVARFNATSALRPRSSCCANDGTHVFLKRNACVVYAIFICLSSSVLPPYSIDANISGLGLWRCRDWHPNHTKSGNTKVLAALSNKVSTINATSACMDPRAHWWGRRPMN